MFIKPHSGKIANCVARDGILTLISHELNKTIKTTSSTTLDDCEFSIPIEDVCRILSAYNNKYNLKIKDGKLIISQGRSRFSVSIGNYNDLGTNRFFNQDDSPSQWWGEVRACSQCLDKLDRPLTSGVYVHNGGIVATNTAIILFSETPVHDVDAIIHVSDVRRVPKDVNVKHKGALLNFSSENLAVASPQIDATYPDYGKIISPDGDFKASFNIDDLIISMERAMSQPSLNNEKKMQNIYLSFNNGLCCIAGLSPTVEYIDEIECAHDGVGRWSINPRYLKMACEFTGTADFIFGNRIFCEKDHRKAAFMVMKG